MRWRIRLAGPFADRKPDPGMSSLRADVPLCVDLDGTLVATDMMFESLAYRLKRRPWQLAVLPLWLPRGLAYFKRRLAQDMVVDAARLPYTAPLVDYLVAERGHGRRLLLVTASDALLAEQIAAHLGLFSEVLASDGKTNLTGRAKAARLVAEFGVKGYDYAGDAWRDLPVWASARGAILVNAGPRLRRAVEKLCPVARSFSGAREGSAAGR